MKPTTREHIRRVQHAFGSGDREAFLDAVERFVDARPEDAGLHVWANSMSDDVYCNRVVAFAIAKSATTQHPLLWGAIAGLLRTPFPQDDIVATNLISALQNYTDHDDLLTVMIAPEFGAFANRCLSGRTNAVEPISDLLLGFVDRSLIASVLNRAQFEAILKVASAESGEVFKALTSVPVQSVPDRFAPSAEALTEAERRIALRSDDAGETVSQALLQLIADTRTAYEAYAHAHEVNGVVEELRLSRGEATKGRILADTFEKLIHAWRTATRDVIASLAPQMQSSMTTYVLAPEHGSFLIQFLITSNSPAIVSQAFEEIVKVADDPSQKTGSSELDVEATAQVLQFLDIVASRDLDVEIGFADTGFVNRERRRFTAAKLVPVLNQLRERRTAKSAREFLGSLEGANFRQGTFELLPDDSSEPIRGDVPSAKRPLLLNKVIGRRYRFSVDEKISSPFTAREPRYSLTRIEPLDEPGPARRSATSRPTEITTVDVPQQDRLDQIADVVRVISTGTEPDPVILGMPDTASSRRHIDYRRHAAKTLGLLTENGTLTEAGRTLAELPPSRAVDFMSVQFELSPVGQSWKMWAAVEDLDHLDPEDAPKFLLDRGFSKSMATRRGRTLRRWLQDFKRRRLGADHADDTGSL
jgi:hypothetical protein